MNYQWDPGKSALNQAKHGLSLADAAVLLTSGSDYLLIFDEAHSEFEDRYLAIGPIPVGIVLVVWTERAEDVIRIISARLATPREIALYRRHMGQGR